MGAGHGVGLPRHHPGLPAGELVRRITGESLGTFFAKEVAGPLGADFHIGLPPPRHDARVAERHPAAPGCRWTASIPTSIAVRTFSNPPLDGRVRRGPRPGAAPRSRPPTGTATPARWPRCRPPSPAAARSSGVRLLSAAGCDAHLRGAGQRHRPRPRRAAAPRHGLRPHERGDADQPQPATCFWGGWGGSLVVNDLDAASPSPTS